MLLLPPAPAALVLLGRAFATLSALSAAAFLLIAVAGPPGALGDDGLAVVEPVEAEPGAFVGDEGRGEDCRRGVSVNVLPGRSWKEIVGPLLSLHGAPVQLALLEALFV